FDQQAAQLNCRIGILSVNAVCLCFVVEAEKGGLLTNSKFGDKTKSIAEGHICRHARRASDSVCRFDNPFV
ncbi:MAG: hypothetical protein AB8B55_05450, partial [Mariniblastus sp.]